MHLIDIVWHAEAENEFVPGIATWADSGDSPVFTPLSARGHLSWTIKGPRTCIGTRDSKGAHIRCPENSIVMANGQRCGPCSAMDQMDPCIRCRGTTCNASESRVNKCRNSQYAVYLAVFKDRTLKVGVSALNRVKTRWLEQGADFAGIVSTIHGGMNARRIEDSLGHLTGITKQVRGERKALGFIQRLDSSAAYTLAQSFLESNGIIPFNSTFALEDLSEYYSVSEIDIQPTPWRFDSASKSAQQLVGDVVGVKGSLLVTRTGSTFSVTNLKHLIGFTVSVDPDARMIAQTGLPDFL